MTKLVRSAFLVALTAAGIASVASCQNGATNQAVVQKPAPSSGGANAIGQATAATKLNWDGLETKGNTIWTVVPTN